MATSFFTNYSLRFFIQSTHGAQDQIKNYITSEISVLI